MTFKNSINPEMDAWVKNFFTENHLAYETFPDKVASPEQLNFMVQLDADQQYYPCSDGLFTAIIEKRADIMLTSAYTRIWSRLERLVNEVISDPYKKQFLLSLLSIKYNYEIANKVHLPQRLEKRLLAIFINISEIGRPMAAEKEQENLRVARFLQSESCAALLDSPEGLEVNAGSTLTEVELQLHLLKLRRLFILSSIREIWHHDEPPAERTLKVMLNTPLENQEWGWWCNWISEAKKSHSRSSILWLAGRSGEIVFDLAIIKQLMDMGIRVILAVKQDFCYHRISLVDILEDPILIHLLEQADIIGKKAISKNELLGYLDNDKRLLVVSDGTKEAFNPLLNSITFARSFKEVDLVISRSHECRETIANTFQFTRDILSIIPGDSGSLDMLFKPHHPQTVRFPQSALRKKAEQLIDRVKNEKQQGKRILFYSAIVGSIPGQLQTAKEILAVFVKHLRSTMRDVVIINPAEHFEEGMDADDIMYMWEIFQRSGMIDIWRFQSVEDIEFTFELMEKQVLPEWSGKDATYSTGCTKEMDIAMEVQQQWPEMQLIGPPLEKFKRRREYGVGKLYDRTLSGQ